MPDLRVQTVHFPSLSVVSIGTSLFSEEVFLFLFELPLALCQIFRILIYRSIRQSGQLLDSQVDTGFSSCLFGRLEEVFLDG